MVPSEAARRQAAFARVMLIIQVPAAIVLGGVVFYVLGFSTRPHHVGSAAVFTAAYLVLMAAGTVFMQRIWRAQARRLASQARQQDQTRA
jgi:hypothetical protein